MPAKKVAILVLAAAVATAGAAFLIRKFSPASGERRPFPPGRTDPAPDPSRNGTTGHGRDPARDGPEVRPGARGGTVRVYVHSGGAAVGGARVTLFREGLKVSGTTEAGGGWVSPEVGAGEWEVGVRHERYMSALEPAEVREGAEAAVTVELRAGARAMGRVTDVRGTPVADVEVSVLHPEKMTPLGFDLRAKTEADGRYAIEGIPLAAVVLHFVSKRHRPGRVDAAFSREGEVLEADVRLADANVLGGRVTDESGMPIEKAVVQAYNDLGGVTETDADGRFLIERLGDGPVNLSAMKRGYGTLYLRDVAPNRTDLAIRLPKAGAVAGRIEADPMPETCEVKLWRYDEYHRKEIMVRGFLHRECRTRPRFRIEDVGPGSYTLTAEAPGWEPAAPVAVVVERGEAAEAAPLRLRRK
ncbi:MAG: carboxypeptidase regulatory-like domain-containing protein [Planctomycetes bacterium]|nr:carboxypeptidase regulatory-like domain-containing protein [Planctomycetota bacterium]